MINNLFAKHNIKSVIRVFTLLFLFLPMLSELNCQSVPCLPRHTGFFQVYNNPIQIPDFPKDMPSDVILGYKILDSIANNVNHNTIATFTKSLQKNDTLKNIRKFLYEITDYDPLLLNAFRFNKCQNYTSFPFNFLNDMNKRLELLQYNSFKNDYAFFSSATIAHVRVLGKEIKNNQNAALAKTEIGLCTEIVDIIKGQHSHSMYCLTLENSQIQKTNSQNKDKYLSFTYCLEWPIYSKGNSNFFDKTVGDLYGDSLFTIGNEYIVFTRLMNYCDYDNKTYFNYATTFSDTSNELLVFPIIDGKVLDSRDEFGFGTNLSVNEFKDELRKRIELIKSMKY